MKLNHSLTLAALALAFAMPLAHAQDDHQHAQSEPGHHEAHADHMLEGYLVVADALYQDNLDQAKQAASGMVRHDPESSLVDAARALSTSSDLAEARQHFAALTEAAIPLAEDAGTLHRAHCPMALDGDGADWLQSSGDEIQNPYMGPSMPRCGSFVEDN